MNINILPALKSIDNSIFIIEGEAENNGAAVVDSYRSINPSVESVTIPHTRHLPIWKIRKNSWNRSGFSCNILTTELYMILQLFFNTAVCTENAPELISGAFRIL